MCVSHAANNDHLVAICVCHAAEEDTFVLLVGLLELLGVVAEEVGHLDAIHEVHVHGLWRRRSEVGWQRLIIDDFLVPLRVLGVLAHPSNLRERVRVVVRAGAEHVLAELLCWQLREAVCRWKAANHLALSREVGGGRRVARLPLPVAFLLKAHGLNGLRTVKKAAACWGGSQEYPPEKIEEAICIAESGAKGTLSAAWLCMLIGAIQMLQGFTPEQVDAIGPAVSVMLLSYFYARILNQVFWHPMERWLRQQALQS